MELEFTIENQIIKRIDSNKVVNLSQEYLEFVFDFTTPDWDDKSKFILFNKDGEKYRNPIIDDKVIVPWNILVSDRILFTVYGVDDDVRITTNQIRINLIESGYGSGKDSPDPIDPDIIEVIFNEFDRYYTKTEINQMLNDLNNKIILNADKTIIQNGETLDLISNLKLDGFLKPNTTIYFYKEDL